MKCKDTVNRILETGQIIIQPIIEPRKGWGLAFKEMSERGDDSLLFNDVFEDENVEEWK